MEKLKSSISKETEIGNCYFDDALGEVIVEVKDPLLFRINDKINLHELSAEIGWKIQIKKGADVPSTSFKTIYLVRQTESEARSQFYKQTGEEIFRSKLSQGSGISLLSLGGFNQVGRSCMLLSTQESKIL